MKYKLLILLILIYPIHSFAEGFKDSFITFSALGVIVEYGDGGALTEKEEQLCRDYTGKEKTYIFLSGNSFNFQLCIYIPYLVQIAEDVSLKFGLKGVDGIVSFKEEVGETSDGTETRANLLEYSYWQIGPVFSINLASDVVDLGIQFYSVYGRIYDGTIEAVPYMREHGYVLNESYYKCGIKGYNIQIGVSPYLALNKYPVYIFGDIHYTYTHIELDRNLPVYGDFDGKANLQTWGIGIGVGLYF